VCGWPATFAAAGHDVAIDDVLEPPAFERIWAPALSGIPYTLLILMPELDEVLMRARGREKRCVRTSSARNTRPRRPGHRS